MDDLSCPGFRFAGVAAGIKPSGAPDIGLIACDRLATCAAVFTRNRIAAAPVAVSRALLARTKGRVRGAVVNSGNANACTGTAGAAAARAMAAAGKAVIGGAALVASTGVIGQPLAMDRVKAGIGAAGATLAAGGFARFAEAIMTTDRRPKVAVRHVVVGRRRIVVLGTTKGAGMIAPNMATTLTFVVTDAAIAAPALRRATVRAVEPTFNAIAVDGDQSTNDTLAVFAGGDTACTPREARAFADALVDLLDDLAHQLIADGEGVHHVVTLEVRGARTIRDARQIARRVAVSPLVKTAIAGGDPNWGRILCAVGNAGVAIAPERIALTIAGVPVARRGMAIAGWDQAAAAAAMAAPAYSIVIDLGAGQAAVRHLACDLSHDYVTINADYTT